MMWLEALLSSLLVAFAFMLLLSTPSHSSHLLDLASYFQLSDRAALLAEYGSDAGPAPLAGSGTPVSGANPLSPAIVAGSRSDMELNTLVFPPSSPEPFCYRWAWLEANSPASYLPADSDFFTPSLSCPPSAFHNASSMRSMQRGVWRQGKLQFLLLEQTLRPA